MQEEKQALSSLTLIKDPLIEPYFIGKDASSYTVYETLMPGNNKKGRGRQNRAKEGIKPLSFHSTFDSCLASIAKHKKKRQKRKRKRKQQKTKQKSLAKVCQV